MQTLATNTLGFQKLFASNQSAASISAPTPTATAPSGDGIIEMTEPFGGRPLNILGLIFFGTRSSADNETFTGRVTGWREVKNSAGVPLWIPVPLLALSMTQGTSTGVAAQAILNTEYFADTITASTAFTSANEILSPADNTIGMVKVDSVGFQKVQVQLAKATNATCNGLWTGW